MGLKAIVVCLFVVCSARTFALTLQFDGETNATDKTLARGSSTFSCISNNYCLTGFYCNRTTGDCVKGRHYGESCHSSQECIDLHTHCVTTVWGSTCKCSDEYRYLRRECKPRLYCYENIDCLYDYECRYNQCYATNRLTPSNKYPLPGNYFLPLVCLLAIGVLTPCLIFCVYLIKREGWNNLTRSWSSNTSSRRGLTTDMEHIFNGFTPSPDYEPPPPYTEPMHLLNGNTIRETGLTNIAANVSDDIGESSPPCIEDGAPKAPTNIQ